MDLNNKLKGFPHVYYFNMDKEVDRRNYMESQFQHYNIANTRISGDVFNASNISEWIDVYEDGKNLLETNVPYLLGNFANHILLLKDWYNTTTEDCLILMEDDYDLGLIDYWHFDWSYLMSKLPFDWDTVQLGYEHYEKVEFFLSHKDYKSLNFGPTLINRTHVKKLLNLYINQNNKITKHSLPYYNPPEEQVSVDFSINHNGKNYTIPLITTNTDFFQDANTSEVYKRHRTNQYIYYYWWTNKRDNFTLDDFFTMFKPNDSEMTEYLHNHASRALSF